VGWYLEGYLGEFPAVFCLGGLGSILLCQSMLIAPLACLRRGEASFYEALKPLMWILALAVLVIAAWPPTGLLSTLLRWNLFWASHLYLLGLLFPVAAGLACFCLGGKAWAEHEFDSLSSRWRTFRVVGLLAAAGSALSLVHTRQTEDQCRACAGTGEVPYLLSLPESSYSDFNEAVVLTEDETQIIAGVVPLFILYPDWAVQPLTLAESNTTVSCLACGGVGESAEALYCPTRRELFGLQKRLEVGDAQAQVEFALYAREGWRIGGFPFHSDDVLKTRILLTEEEKDTITSVYWMELAAEQGNADAQYYLGRWGFSEVRDEPFNLDHLLKAADQGHVMAQDVLAKMYLRGQNGVEEDLEEGARWCKLASESGQDYANAHQRLARVYSKGWGVSEDLTLATELYRRAALLGDSWSMQKLSSRYERGYGVEQDRAWAYAWGVMAIVFWHPQSWGSFGVAGIDIDEMSDAELDAAREHTWELWELLRHVEIRRDVEDDILPVHPL